MSIATFGLPEGRSGPAHTWAIVNPAVSLCSWTNAISFSLMINHSNKIFKPCIKHTIINIHSSYIYSP